MKVRRLGSRPAGNFHRNYNFSELVPTRITSFGVAIYDVSSFRGGEENATVVDAPFRPSLIKADSMFVHERDASGEILPGRNLGNVNVLFFHGISERGKFWRQKGEPYEDVEKIVSLVEREGIEINTLLICNPGGYLLHHRDSVAPYTYFLSGISGLVTKRDENIIVHGDGNGLFIKGEVS